MEDSVIEFKIERIHKTVTTTFIEGVRSDGRLVFKVNPKIPLMKGDSFVFQKGRQSVVEALCAKFKADGAIEFGSVNRRERPLFIAGGGHGAVRAHIESLFTSSDAKKIDEIVACLSRLSEKQRCTNVESFLTAASREYMVLRESEDASGEVSTLIGRERFEESKKRGQKVSEAAAFVHSICPKRRRGENGEISPRQLEFILMKWYETTAFRPFHLLGVTTRQATEALQDPFLVSKTRPANKCACKKMFEWCGTAKPVITSESSKCFSALYAAIVANPFAIPTVTIETASDIYLSAIEYGAESNIEVFAKCGEMLRELKSQSLTSSCKVLETKKYEEIRNLKPLLECVFGVCFYERKDNVCVYAYDRFLFEGRLAEFIKLCDAPRSLVEDKEEPSHLTPDQLKAVHDVVGRSGQPHPSIVCITGGPGVGKTTILKEIMKRMIEGGISFRLCSFTGKAVARIREQTGCDKVLASTIDRLIAKRDVSSYEHLLVDEASMVPVELLARFLYSRHGGPSAANLKLTLIGDMDQLMSIGWGSAFYVCLKLPFAGSHLLKTNFRIEGSEKESEMHSAFDAIRNGKSLSQFKKKDASFLIGSFSIIERVDDCISYISNLVKRAIDNGVISDPAKIGIFSPYNALVDKLNVAIRPLFTADLSQPFNVGDRIFMSKNVYFPKESGSASKPLSSSHRVIAAGKSCGTPGGCHIQVHGLLKCTGCDRIKILKVCGVEKTAALADPDVDPSGLAYMNGDTGVVKAVTATGFVVDFDTSENKGVQFSWKEPSFKDKMDMITSFPDSPSETGEVESCLTAKSSGPSAVPLNPKALTSSLLKLGFALTIHKSQGSEYDHVIVLTPRSGQIYRDGEEFLTRNLFYTGCTRARKSVTVVTSGTCVGDIDPIMQKIAPKRIGNLFTRAIPETPPDETI
jgi:hypothetical protein